MKGIQPFLFLFYSLLWISFTHTFVWWGAKRRGGRGGGHDTSIIPHYYQLLHEYSHNSSAISEESLTLHTTRMRLQLGTTDTGAQQIHHLVTSPKLPFVNNTSRFNNILWSSSQTYFDTLTSFWSVKKTTV